ncbi:MAG: hypothetical protein B6241_04530 [Spirochaetaceae bacterium 4572_59]|nr:MAG: hypothetical protein B6241_04530 [Spirochaetaceae bacterium 4572_59]
MVQLSSPKPDIQPLRTGDKKIRTQSRIDQTQSPERSKFQESLENEKSIGKKVSEKSAVSKKTTTAKQNSEDIEHELVNKKIVKKKSFSKKSLKNQNSIQSEVQLLLNSKSEAVSVKNHKSDTLIRVKKSSSEKKGSSQESSQLQTASVAASQMLQTGLVKAGLESSSKEDTLVSAELRPESPSNSLEEEFVQSVENSEIVKEGVDGTLLQDQRGHQNLAGKKKNSSGRTVRGGGLSDSPQISVEDRRTVKTEDARAVFAVAKKQDRKELTLEMAPKDDLTGTTVMVEAKDSTTQFVLNSAEEQKGSFLLNKQLQEGGTKELAKNIRFVLKDHNQGEIKLILKPEALGKVRIQLNLQENNIVGKIFVENNSVKQVFLNNLSNLTKALEDSGFQTSSL